MPKVFDILAFLMGKAAGGGGGGGEAVLIDKSVSSNGTYNASSDSADGYKKVVVSVPNSYAAGDEGKVVSNGALVSQTAHAEVTSNGTIDTTLNNSVFVNVSGGGGVGLEYETGTWTPTEDVAEATISFDDAHSGPPYEVMLFDTTGTSAIDNSVVSEIITSFYDAYGATLPYGNKILYGRVDNLYTSSGSVTSVGAMLTSANNLNTWRAASGFRAYCQYNYVYFRAGRTYKWVAVWAPTA